MKIDTSLYPSNLSNHVEKVFSIALEKIFLLDNSWNYSSGSPVFTIDGIYSTRGWTEWTQGFQFGAPLLAFEATNDKKTFNIGLRNIKQYMSKHLTHTGVHDHGFNTMSTYGNLLRLFREGKWLTNNSELNYLHLAIKISGAVQANRWTSISNNLGFIYSFNGPHSLFIDTIRSLRVLAIAHKLGHSLMGENDKPISLLERLLQHTETTLSYSIFFGNNRDIYDIPGRVAHESIFNVRDGNFRCVSTQQGYSPFSTWTRGLSWAILGIAELLEFCSELTDEDIMPLGIPRMPNHSSLMNRLKKTAVILTQFYIANSTSDGITYWDTGAPGLSKMSDWCSIPSNPFNDFEPIDSSAAAIAAQGFLRIGYFLQKNKEIEAKNLIGGGLTIAKTLFSEPYLNTTTAHQGILLHTIYHRPNNWDRIPTGSNIPYGESCQWGDYHTLELALLIQKINTNSFLPWVRI